MVKTTFVYGSEIWTLKEEDDNRSNVVEMDYLRRSAVISRRKRRRNEEIRNIMSATATVLDRIEKRGLKWFGNFYLWGMEGGLSAFSHGNHREEKARKSWNDGIRTAAGDRNLEEDTAYDRQEWRLVVGKQHLVVKIYCILTIYINASQYIYNSSKSPISLSFTSFSQNVVV